jgi:hypothetical protein
LIAQNAHRDLASCFVIIGSAMAPPQQPMMPEQEVSEWFFAKQGLRK